MVKSSEASQLNPTPGAIKPLQGPHAGPTGVRDSATSVVAVAISAWLG